MKWNFSFDQHWSMTPIGGMANYGTATVEENLDKKKYIDTAEISKYKVSLDVSLKEEYWDAPRTTAGDTQIWRYFCSDLERIQTIKNAIPKLPTFDLILFDISFFLVQNLLLPNQNVIEFKTEPGARFPRDLYLVGNIVHKSKVMERIATNADFANFVAPSVM